MNETYPNETYRLCFALKESGYQAEAAADPAKWNEEQQAMGDEHFNKGYGWTEHPTLGWYPNPGRKALKEEIVKLNPLLEGVDGSHEELMQVWLNEKAKADEAVAPSETGTQ